MKHTLITALLLALLPALHAAEPVTIDLSKRTWQGIPGLERTAKGRVFASWFTGGPKEPSPDNTVVLSHSDDGGKTFSAPEAMALPMSNGTRCFDPTLWIDPKGRLWYIFNRGNKDTAKHDVWARICYDPDASPPVWAAEFRVGYDGPYAFRMNKPTVLSSGEWLMPVTHATETIRSWFAGPKQLQGVGISTDEGRTWKLHGALKAPEWALECMITELKDGRLWLLTRTGGGFLWESHSPNKGRTWSEAKASTIANPGSRFFIRRLSSGNLLLVNHYKFTGRSHLTARISTDDGGTWNEGLLLDDRKGVSYPDGLQDKDGLIWISYDRDRNGAGEILLAKFREEDVAAGKDISQAVALKQVISKLEAKTMNTLSADEAERGFVSLFDGVSFDGWEQKGNWSIEDGAFSRVRDGGPLMYVAKTVPDDFEVRFEWKVSKGCNSGVYYRPGQVEYQVLDNVSSPYGENPRQAAASLFFCMAPMKDATRPLGEWQAGRIVCKGTVIQHWLNGVKVIDFDYTDPKWAEEMELLRIRGGDLTGRGGKLWLQDHGAPVWFRKLRWRAIPASESLVPDPKFQPMPIPPAALAKEQARVRGMLEKAKPSLLPSGWEPKRAGDEVIGRIIKVSAPQVKGAHDADLVLVGERAFIVEHDNDIKPGHGAGKDQYCVLTVVNVKTMSVERVVPMAKSAQVFANETLPVGACFVPRIIQMNDTTLRCFFACEDQSGKSQSQTWYRDFDLTSLTFAPDIHRVKLKTSDGAFDMQPQYFHADAAKHGFKQPAKAFGLYLLDAFKVIDGKTYLAINNFPGAQNALAMLNESRDTIEVIGHYNEPAERRLTESSVNRLPDGTWMAICRTESGDRNYVFTTSKDGKTWTQGESRPFVSKGSNSKPTFDKFNGIYYLGWQEASRITDGHGVGRYIFNIEVSHDGLNWERKYRFESPNSFQYPTFRQHDGSIWFTVTQGTGGSTDRIMFGKLESLKPALQAQQNKPTNDTSAPPPPAWDQIRRVPMSGGLRAFWNVAGGDNATNYREAAAHGFEMVDLLNTYSDYPGRQKENIRKTLDANKTNPWQKPEFFERIVKRNIEKRGNQNAIFVHDIEFSFEEDIDKVWVDPVVRAVSKTTTREQFADAYLREWATWFTLPCQWAKERYPSTPIGIYGPQPFRRDYFGISGKSAQQIDGTHHSDAELWQHIDPFVDYYIASIYVFYDKPDSIYYMAANVEENVERTRRYGSKPLYAYEWLRYHSSNKKLAEQEVAPWLAEAMAVLPYFCGARGLALWGSEPKRQGQYYHTLPVFTASLGRVSDLSAKIAAAKLMPDEPAHVLWKAKRPLIRRMRVSADEWVILAVNPWQAEDATSTVEVPLEKGRITIELRGRHSEIFHCVGESVKRL